MATASITVGANTGGGAREYVAAALDVLDEWGFTTSLRRWRRMWKVASKRFAVHSQRSINVAMSSGHRAWRAC